MNRMRTRRIMNHNAGKRPHLMLLGAVTRRATVPIVTAAASGTKVLLASAASRRDRCRWRPLQAGGGPYQEPGKGHQSVPPVQLAHNVNVVPALMDPKLPAA